jgi:hypothetical protein
MAPERHDRTVPSGATREEEDRDGRVPSGNATADELSEGRPQSEPPDGVDEEAAEHYREMTERGAHQKGEGRLP